MQNANLKVDLIQSNWPSYIQRNKTKMLYVCHVLWLHQRARAHLMLLGSLALLLCLPALIFHYVTAETQHILGWLGGTPN